jgi:hypothetical protein
MSYFRTVSTNYKPGTLVAHQVIRKSTEENDIYRYGIIKFIVDEEHVFVMWCPCEAYPVSKNNSIYSSPVKKGFLEVLNEIP